MVESECFRDSHDFFMASTCFQRWKKDPAQLIIKSTLNNWKLYLQLYHWKKIWIIYWPGKLRSFNKLWFHIPGFHVTMEFVRYTVKFYWLSVVDQYFLFPPSRDQFLLLKIIGEVGLLFIYAGSPCLVTTVETDRGH